MPPSEIGAGAYGPVYRCRLGVEEREVAVKIVGDELLSAARGNSETVALIERMFMAEVRTLGHLRHPNVVRILAYSSTCLHRKASLSLSLSRILWKLLVIPERTAPLRSLSTGIVIVTGIGICVIGASYNEHTWHKGQKQRTTGCLQHRKHSLFDGTRDQ